MAWRAHLQNEMYWYNRYASEIVAKLSSKLTPVSIAKWSVFIMGTSFCWCTTGFCIGPLFFLIYINDLTKDISWTNNYLLMIPPFSLLQLILMFLNMSWTVIWEKDLWGPINGRCPSIHMFQSRLKRWYSLKKIKKYSTQLFYLIEKLNFNTYITEK